MLKSFYNYLVDELILGYFKKNPVEKGSRYFLIIENEEHRNGLIEAMRSHAETITLSGIYQSNGSAIIEEPYDTLLLRPQKDATGLIVGYDETSTEDYLTTIRNSVGVKGGKYEDYGVLFVLSDSTSSILSSLNTTVRSLQATGYPLHAHYIIQDIESKAKDKLSKDLELIYLKKHLEKISDYIGDGICNLFDFQHALGVLSEGTLRGHYNEIDFFNDKTVYNVVFKPTDSDMKIRVDKNHDIYRKVSDIMNEDDETDKFKLLNRFLDEKLCKKVLNSTNWKEIDFQEFLDSEQRKAATANLELLDISLLSEGLMTSMVLHTVGNKKKKSTSHIIICDETGSSGTEVKLTFNKEIKKAPSNNDCIVNGQTMKVTVKDKIVTQSVGLNDNHHDFYIMRLSCNKNFFKNINQYFSINKKEEITVIVPEEPDMLVFGDGSTKCSIPLDGRLDWFSDALLEVPVSADDEQDKIRFSVNFEGKEVPFILKLNVAKPLPPVGPKDYPQETPGHLTPTGILNGEETRGVYSYWRGYLEWEKAFVDNSCSTIFHATNDITGEYEPEYVMLALPQQVKVSLLKIYDYFRTNDTIPSLCPLTDELKMLYIRYFNSVKDIIEMIPNNRSLTIEEYNITKLGVVVDWNRIYLSPFHPINVAYMLEYNNQYDNKEEAAFAKKLLSPFYLLPYIYFNSSPMRPYTDRFLSEIRNWLSYEGINSKPQERTNDITTKMVWTKMESFIRHFNYLFQDKDCPIIIGAIGIPDDTNIVKGLVEFIRRSYSGGVQRVEIHEYVDNLMEETFFEKLNRLDSIDSITRELESQNLKLEAKGEYTSQEIIHQLFTRVSFYKHDINTAQDNIGYCHIAFYQMDTGSEFIRQMTHELRTELSFSGLISIPSTVNKNDTYIIGYGTKGMNDEKGFIHPMTKLLNNLYANEEHEGSSVFSSNTCVAKWYKFGKSTLLNSIYDNANWVTFINPEVDINFFYKQKNLYVVHYTDQYTINAKYDSITVTKHIDQYANMLRLSYDQYALSEERFQHFNETMMNYFNCLNGSWMLDIVNQTDVKIREKMSIVAACIAMLRFMKRNNDILWIPMSLEEVLRVTGSIGLPQEYIFTKKTLGVKGSMSDDLLMMGLDKSVPDNLKLYLYPVEVKASKNGSMADKGGKQVSQTFCQLKQHLYGDSTFVKNIYRTFFASQFLTNAEKLNANSLLSDEEFAEIEDCRFDLLNLNYSLAEQLPAKEMGNAAVVSFFSSAPHSLTTSIVDNVPVCEIHFSEQECVQFVAEPENNHMSFLENGIIQVDAETMNFIENPDKSVLDENLEEEIEVSVINDDIIENQNSSDESPVKVEQKNEIETEGQSAQAIKIVVGRTRTGNREIVFEPNNTKMVSHPNMGIIGTMGTGKTQFARSVIAQFSKEGMHNVGGKPVGMLVFDYKGDYKDKEFLDAVGGKCYKFNYPFNPLKLVVNDEVEGMNLPAITADRISDSFAKAYGLGLKQQSNIKQVIIETYADAGITKVPETWNNPVPTMEQVIEKYFSTYDANDKAYALFDKLRDYTIFTTDNSNCVSLFEWLDSVRVIDLTLYPDDTKKVIVSLILDLFYAEMRQLGGSLQKDGFRELRAIIMVDEAHQFLKKDFNSFRSIISEGRMFGVGMILSTQNVSDFKSQKEDYSQFILSWVIHHVNDISRSEVASIFGSSDSNADRYRDFISKAKLFESVCKIGSRVEGIRDLPFFELVKQDERFKPKELSLFD